MVVVVALFAVVVTVVVALFTVIVVVRFVRGVFLCSRQLRDLKAVDDLRVFVRCFKQGGHERVVAAAVDDDNIGFRQFELVVRRRFVVVRVL